ncbi:MAG TPA: hypothetical protein VKW78_20770 [Terriglobales bacterium]|nr:hypothetical protein [Terriglobales bacterium]
MAFCSKCGKPLEAGSACADCGHPSTTSEIELMTAELRRQRKEVRYVFVGFGAICVLAVCFVAVIVVRWQRAPRLASPATVAQQPSPQIKSAPTPTVPVAAQAPDTQTAVGPNPGAPQVAPRRQEGSASADQSAGNKIDAQEVQNALNSLAQGGGQRTVSPSAPAAPSASDRYPGSEPVDVKDAALPDIGIPVASQVYATSDSVSTVVDYYKQLYPDAQVMEMSGQNIIAVDRPGATKVIAIGKSETGTTIAIVQPGN